VIRPAQVADAERLLLFLREFRAEGLLNVFQPEKFPTLAEEQSFIRNHVGTAGVIPLALKDDAVEGTRKGAVNIGGRYEDLVEMARTIRSVNITSRLTTPVVSPSVPYACGGLRSKTRN
jgi:hypothetical protein